ncbi:amino acid transporter, partial [Penicillium vulpinum]|uniref:amino acid transporter n=1 Tax=Penicillium vulpinum TaxID=29845 RepID=UPI0025481969
DKQLGQRTAIPFHSIWIIVIPAGLIILINIGPTILFHRDLSLLMESFFFSYITAPISKFEGVFWSNNRTQQRASPEIIEFLWTLNSIFALVFAGAMVMLGSWPAETHPMLSKMN